MKEPKFKKVRTSSARTFSDWVQPKMTKYLMACCDCALVHEMQFRVVATKAGRHKVQFRVRKAVGHTKHLRRRERDGR